jgi:sulfate-transporting ATPase
VTIGLALCIDELVLENTNYTGGLVGTVVKPPSLFGWNIYSVPYPDRYAAVCTVVFLLAALLVANLRRGAAGRRLLAVRANERAAESLGISVVGAKLYAFGLGAAIAAAGGILLAFEVPNVNFTLFGGLQSITAVIDSVIGGIGFIGGALIGGSFGDQGVNQEILGHWGTLANYVTIGSGALLVLVVIFNQDGLAWDNIRMFRAVEGRLAKVLRRRPAATQALSLATSDIFAGDLPEVDLAEPRAPGAVAVKARPVAPARPAIATAGPPARTAVELTVKDVKVAFGGVQALNGVTLSVAGGEVVGVIGPNGAGKTALLDVISGINRNYSGVVHLDGESIDGWSAYRRARGGIGRASQSLDLFEDESVFDNLRTACDARSRGRYFSDLVWPGNRPLPAQAETAIDELGISGLLEQRPKELSYGRRRLVAIARALAASPAILLLDEPASGLDDRNTANLSALIRRIADEWGIGILLIEHDMPLVMKVCDRVTVLNFGNQIATGTGAAVRNDPAVIAAYLGEPVSDDEQDAAGSGAGLASGQPTAAS